MSSLIVEVCRIDDVFPHPNADRMAIARVKGWTVCIRHDPENGQSQFSVGDKCVYFPPDTVIPHGLSDRLGVTKYLSPLPKDVEGNRPDRSRIRVAKLRGYPSYGLIMACEDQSWSVGHNVADFYEAAKYEPPPVHSDGDKEKGHPAFHRYHDMENIRNFPDLFEDGEEVVITEKIHGMNCRLGLIREEDESGEQVWRWAAGSHDVRRKRVDAKGNVSVFWECFSEEVKQLMIHLSGCGYAEDPDGQPIKDGQGADIVVFGERFGAGVQKGYWYGLTAGTTSFRAFDITVNGAYLGFEEKNVLFERFGVPTVPVLYRGPFTFAKVEELASGPSTVLEGEGVGDDSQKVGREGVVVTSVVEGIAETPHKIHNRRQLKCISFEYLARKGGTEYH